ncbi:MAG: LacI family DNA-binding transcriptional regulator, partial [Reyranellales bacterium]
MSDVARHAGVSPMTVSRALSEPGTVSEKMQRKVDA